jgi:hypothetical protein
MKRLLYYPLILLLFFNSCKKEDERKAVTAGVYDSTFTYHEFLPPLKVTLQKDTLNNYSFGADSADIDMDGNFDLIINQRFPDKYISRFDTENSYPFCSLMLKNGLEVATKRENYSQGQGYWNYINWVDSLHFETRIDNLSDWSDTNTSRAMWLVAPTIFWGSNGCWYNLTNSEMYIGIRMKIDVSYHYGWIKVNQISRENMLFISFAMEK